MNEQTAAIIILALSCICLPIYYKTRNFFKFPGILLVLCGLIAIYLRFFIINRTIQWFNTDGFIQTLLIVWIPGIICISYWTYKAEYYKGHRIYLLKLLPLYMFFGAIQQIFFICIISESLFILTSNIIFSWLFGSLYFVLFHLNWKRLGIQKYFPLTILFGLISIGCYLFFNNILPQLAVHGLVGAFLFAAHRRSNQLNYRFK